MIHAIYPKVLFQTAQAHTGSGLACGDGAGARDTQKPDYMRWMADVALKPWFLSVVAIRPAVFGTRHGTMTNHQTSRACVSPLGRRR